MGFIQVHCVHFRNDYHFFFGAASFMISIIYLNSGLREAPPTRKPSISGFSIKDLLFAALAEPP
jgi:hypothetical protein